MKWNVVCVLATCSAVLVAQMPPVTILEIDVDNVVVYCDDVMDPAKKATVPGISPVPSNMILQSDGSPVGSLEASGLSSAAPSLGAPAATTSMTVAIVGGTGPFMGARGQLSRSTDTARTASMLEDPAYRRVNGGGKRRAGEQLIVSVSGLGPVRPNLEFGKPFPPYLEGQLHEVSSPVDVTVNGKDAKVVNKIGWPGTPDLYRVDFVVAKI